MGFRDFLGTGVHCVEHSRDLVFIAYLQHFRENEPDDDGYLEDSEELFVSAIDARSGHEVWRKGLYNGGPIGPKLAYSDSSAQMIVSTEWCCTPSCSEFFMLDSLTGHMVMEHLLEEVIQYLAVVESLVVMATHNGDRSESEEDQYEIVVWRILPLSPGEFFRTMADEYVCEMSVLQSRYLYWVSYNGRVVLIDMIVGEKLLDACLGYAGFRLGEYIFSQLQPIACLGSIPSRDGIE